MPPHSRAEQGFTLIELMIVVVIIGILASVAVPKFSQVSRSAKEAEAMPILKQLYTLQERYKQKNDSYATVLADLEGGTSSFTGAKYYTFSLPAGGGGTSYIACATPTVSGLKYFTIDSDRQVQPHDSGCS